MANANDIVKLAVDSYKGRTLGNYSVGETQETLRQALIDLNGGSTKLDIRALRDHPQMFTIIEEIITLTTLDGLPETNPLFGFTEERNVALGDSLKFEIEDGNSEFVVSQIAEGTQGIRRQRLNVGQSLTPDMKLYGVKIYEELNRVLAGRIDFNKMIDKVARSFQKKINEDTLKATQDAFKALKTPYKQSGSFDISKLITIIDHVEAATGMTATVITSKQGARNIADAVGADTVHNVGADAASAKEDVYNFGYYTHIGQNPVLAMNNAHKTGTNNLILGNEIYVVGTEDKFIKRVTEGNTLIINGDMYKNADLSQEYLCAQRWGTAVVMANEAGFYDVP